MSEAEINWDEVEEEVVSSIPKGSKKEVRPVPDKIKNDAQASWDNQERVKKTFPTDKIAKAYADLMKDAGEWTEPKCSMWVKQDGRTVEYSAGERRGRKGAKGEEPSGQEPSGQEPSGQEPSGQEPSGQESGTSRKGGSRK